MGDIVDRYKDIYPEENQKPKAKTKIELVKQNGIYKVFVNGEQNFQSESKLEAEAIYDRLVEGCRQEKREVIKSIEI